MFKKVTIILIMFVPQFINAQIKSDSTLFYIKGVVPTGNILHTIDRQLCSKENEKTLITILTKPIRAKLFINHTFENYTPIEQRLFPCGRWRIDVKPDSNYADTFDVVDFDLNKKFKKTYRLRKLK